MTNEEKELIVYCLKANSDFHVEVCEECKNYPKCDHFQADSLMEKLIKALEQEECEDAVSRQAVLDEINEWIKSGEYGYTNATYYLRKRIDNLQSVNPQEPKTSYISIDDVMSVFDDFMCGEVDEDGTETFLEMLKDKAESEEE